MQYRITQTLQHAFRPKSSITSSVLGLSIFSLCRTSSLGRRGLADSTPGPSQSPQDLDEAQLKEERRRAQNEYRRAWYRKKKEDPVWLEQHRKRDREYAARWRETQNKDEVSKERHLDYMIRAFQKSVKKTKQDPVKLQSYRARQRAKRKQWAAAYTFRRLQAFKEWFHRSKADLDTFTWNRWRPVFLTESVDKTCAACGMRNRRGPRRLWFIRKSDPELWDCTSCFVSSDLSETVPIEGAERFYNGVYLQPEPTATEGTVDHKDTHEVVDRIDGNDHV